MFHYLLRTQDYCIHYEGNAKNFSSFVCNRNFVCTSDALFANNSVDRKSSQGYLMKLFGGAVAWKANKQDIVTTFSTEAELLAVLQTAKEAIYLARLMKALKLVLSEALTVECNNLQTICLLVDEAAKLQTKLRHVDIHSHWLRQEVQRRTIHIHWVPTKDMIADGLTKALTTVKHEIFVEITSLEDQGKLLASIKMEEDKKKAAQRNQAEGKAVSEA